MKTQTAIRLEQSLIELLKIKAKAQNRSLNNFIEFVLKKEVGNIPNNETIAAIEEAKTNKNRSPITDLESYKNQLLSE